MVDRDLCFWYSYIRYFGLTYWLYFPYRKKKWQRKLMLVGEFCWFVFAFFFFFFLLFFLDAVNITEIFFWLQDKKIIYIYICYFI